MLLVGCASHHAATYSDPSPPQETSAAPASGELGELALDGGGARLRLRPRLPAPTKIGKAAGARVERVRGEVVEIVERRPEGLEISWRFERRPSDGNASVTLDVAEGKVLGPSADGVRVQLDRTTFRIGDGVFIDADGVRTKVPATVVDGAIAYAVPADVVKSSRFPAVLDPTVSAEVEVDAPPLVTLAASPRGVDFDGTNFVVALDALGTSIARVSPAGALVDSSPLHVASGSVIAIASGTTESLVLWQGDPTTSIGCFATRVGKDGKVLDATPLDVSGGQCYGGESLAFDGGRYLVAWSVGPTSSGTTDSTVHLTAISPAGVVSHLPDLPSTFTIPAAMGAHARFRCAGGICALPSSEYAPTGTCVLALIGPGAASKLVGCTLGQPSFPLVASNAAGFVAVEDGSLGDPTPLALKRISTTDLVGSSEKLSISGARTFTDFVGDGSGYLLAESSDAGYGVARIAGTTPFSLAWSAPAIVPRTPELGTGGSPLLAVSGGKALLVYDDLRSTPLGVVFDSAIAPTSPTPLVLAHGAPTQRGVVVASDGKNFLAAWTELRGDQYQLRARRLDATGKALDAAPTMLATAKTTYAPEAFGNELRLVWDGVRYVVAWRPFSGSGGRSLSRVRVAQDGSVLDAVPDVVDVSGYVSNTPAVAGGGGRTLVAWGDVGALLMRRYDATGAAVDATPVPLGGTLELYGYTPISASYDGKNTLVTWPTPAGVATDLMGVVVGDTGAPGTPFVVCGASGRQDHPASASNGTVHLVAWSDANTSPTRIRAARVDAKAGVVLDATPIVVFAGSDAYDLPRVVWDGSVFVVSAARILNAYSGSEVVIGRVRADGVVVAEPTASATKSARDSSLASDGKGTTMVAFTRDVVEPPYVAARARLVTYVAKHPAGSACTSAAECEDGNCADGVCCTSACTGPCQACDVAGSVGTCATASGRPHGTRTCGGGSDACSLGACDGKDGTKCASFAIAVGGVCAAPVCSGSTFTAPGMCGATRSCAVPSPTDCSPYRCSSTGCLKTCTSDDQCQNAHCVDGSCVPSPTGARCSDDKLSSVVTDGTVRSCAPFRCDTSGACATKCTASDECVPGFVCDGAGACAPQVTDGGGSGGCSVSRPGASGAAMAWLVAIGVVWGVRRRRAALVVAAAATLGGCRANAEPTPREVVRTHVDALHVGVEGTTVDATSAVDVASVTTIGCHSAGCLVLQKRKWLTAVRLGSDGKPLDVDGFLVAHGPVGDLDSGMSVGSNGTDYLVSWSRPSRVPMLVRLSGAGAVLGAPFELVPAALFAQGQAIGWDTKSYLVVWQDFKSGTATLMGARVLADGTKLDPVGFAIYTSSVGDGSAHFQPHLACDGKGCFVSLALPGGEGSGKIVRVEDGKTVGAPTSTAFSLSAMTVDGTDFILGGTNVTGAAGVTFARYSSALAPKSVVKLTETSNSLVLGHAGANLVSIAGVNFATGFFLSAARLDSSLTKVEHVEVEPTNTFAGASLGSSFFCGTASGLYEVTTSPLAFSRRVIEHHAAPHQFPSVATGGGTTLTAFARRADGVDAVLVAKTASGAFTPSAGTLVANESAPIRDVAMTWDGSGFVVAWLTDARVAFARVDASGAVTDVGGVKIGAVSTTSPWTNVSLGVGSSGAIVLLGGDQLGTIRLSGGAALDTTPKLISLRKPLDSRLATAASAGTSLVAWADDDGVELLRIGGDGKPLDAAPHLVPKSKGIAYYQAEATPSVAFDGKGWTLVYPATAGATSDTDIYLARTAFDLSGVPDTWVVSARDYVQLSPGLAIDGEKAVVTWSEASSYRFTPGDTQELRASWVDLSAKKSLVDADLVATYGYDEIERPSVASFSGTKAELVYVRHDPDPTILSPRIKTRTITFDGLGGATCKVDADCELGPCVDGTCCDRKCDGTCEACDVAGSVGKCVTIAGKPHGARSCATGTTCAEATCDGFEPKSCQRFAHAFETTCAAAKCDGALFSAPGFCDGKGACAVPTTASCAPFACDPNGCLTSCTTDASCAKDFLCKDKKCVGPENGAVCVDDGLGSKAVDGKIKDCAPYRCSKDGTCGQTCGSAAECAPGDSCDATGACVPPTTASSGGCDVVASTDAPVTAWVVLAGLALGGALLRRRK